MVASEREKENLMARRREEGIYFGFGDFLFSILSSLGEWLSLCQAKLRG